MSKEANINMCVSLLDIYRVKLDELEKKKVLTDKAIIDFRAMIEQEEDTLKKLREE